MSSPDHRYAIYAGSFDPITLGHTAIIDRAARLYERVTVAVGANIAKQGLFTVEERVQLAEGALAGRANVEIQSFEGLLVEYADRLGAGVLVRGLRLLTDFEHEFQLALGNRDLHSEIETVFLMTDADWVYVSSSLVKEIAANGGDCTRYVTPAVAAALRRKYATPEA